MTSISVVIVAFHSGEALARTLPALRRELAGTDELIVVDNAGEAGLETAVHADVPRARVLVNDHNAGFADGVARGAAAATGDVLVLLNPDAVPAHGWGDAIRAPRGRWDAWMALVTAADGREINTSGGVVHFTGLAWAGEAHAPVAAAPSAPRPVGFLSGACLAIPRATWERLGGFAPGYFMYHEDVELSLRLRLEGGRIGVEPAARVDHAYEFVKGPLKWRSLERNRWATILRTYPGPVLLAVLPALAAMEVVLLLLAARGGWLEQKRAALGDTARALPRLVRERRAVQASRRISAGAFAAGLEAQPSSRYLGALGRSPVAAAALRAYWRLARAVLR